MPTFYLLAIVGGAGVFLFFWGMYMGNRSSASGDLVQERLQAFAGNLVSAGLRLGLIGQTDGQRILAALEPVVAGIAAAALTREPADFGAASFAADLASMVHESQHVRLFRS